MRLWQSLLVLLVIALLLPGVNGSMGSCAKMVLFDSKTTRLYNQDDAKYITETKITFEMGLKETVCFKVLDGNGAVTDGEVDGKTFYLTFEDVQQIFTYKNSYEFATPEIVAKCVCDCPGLEDHCSPKRDSCAEDKNKDPSCFKYYAPDQNTDGCGLLSSIGAGEVCCSVSVKPWEKDIYTAIEISTPATKARFRFEESKPYSSSQHNVDLDSAAKFFANKLTVSFANPGKSNPIPADWYYGSKASNEVLTNVDINALDEWDLDKLGWYKYDEGSYNLDNTLVQRAFSGKVTNCDESSMDITFASKFNARKVEEAKPLSEYFKSSVEKAVRDDVNRNVYIEFRSFSRVSVMINIDGEKQVIQQFSMPSYLDYYGSVLLDKYSNRFINVTIVSGRGTLYGTLVTKVEEDKKWIDKEVENFEVIVPSQEDVTKYNYTKYVLITSPCSPDSTAQLCIHTGSKNDQECKAVECNEEPLEDFVLADSTIDYTKGSKDSLLSPSTWLKYLNPMEWFNGVTGMQEGVVMVVGIVGFLILLAVLLKCCHCFNCIFRCFKCCFKLSCLSHHKDKMEEHAQRLNFGKHGMKRHGGRRKKRSEYERSGSLDGASDYSEETTSTKISRAPLNRHRSSRMGGSIRSAGSSLRNSFKKSTQNMSNQTQVLIARLLNNPDTRNETLRTLGQWSASQDDLERRDECELQDTCRMDGRYTPPPPYHPSHNGHKSTKRKQSTKSVGPRIGGRKRSEDDYFNDKRNKPGARSTRSTKSAKNRRRSREDVLDHRGHRPSQDIDPRGRTLETNLDSSMDNRYKPSDINRGNERRDRTMDNRRSRKDKKRRNDRKSGYETDTSASQSSQSLPANQALRRHSSYTGSSSSVSDSDSDNNLAPHINIPISRGSDSDLSTDNELKPGVSECVVTAQTPLPRTPIMTNSRLNRGSINQH